MAHITDEAPKPRPVTAAKAAPWSQQSAQERAAVSQARQQLQSAKARLAGFSSSLLRCSGVDLVNYYSRKVGEAQGEIARLQEEVGSR
jgi:hypothetical protein